MKRIAFVFLIIIAHFVYGQDTIRICDRIPNYFYGDMWVDQYSHFCQGSCDMRHCIWQANQLPSIVVKRLDTDTALNIIGIAAPILIDTSHSIDDSNHLAEYFYLYNYTDSGCVLVADVRWDTATPHRQMEFVFGLNEFFRFGSSYPYEWGSDQPDTGRICFPVYEAYFPKSVPITVSDSFFVGASMYNIITGTPYGWGGASQSPWAGYIRWINNLTGQDNNLCPRLRFGGDKTDFVMYPENGEIDPTRADALQYNFCLWGGFGCIFPIFGVPTGDTASHYDTCYGTTGFRIMSIDNESVILGWSPDGNSRWEISLYKGDTATASPESGAVGSFTESFASFYYLDTAWYTAYVRTVCEDDIQSEWSEPLTFHFPPIDTTTTPESVWQTYADRYTTVMPNPAHNTIAVLSSFQLLYVDIYSLDGKNLIHSEASGITAQLDISALPPSTYIVRIKTQGGIATRKLVKQ